jgi:hypothetical protein
MTQEQRKFPLTVAGLYATPTPGNARSAVLTQENADKACAAIQAAVGGKLALKKTRDDTKKEKGDKFPDFFLEAVTPDMLAEERARMALRGDNRTTNKYAGSKANFEQGDDSL